MKRTLSWVAAAAVICASGAALARGKAEKGGSKLVLQIGPPDTEIWVDGQKKGTADKVKEISLSPGTHDLDFKHKGDEHTDQVTIKKGQRLTFTWKFEDDKPKARPFDDSTGDAHGDQLPVTPPPANGGTE
jgi:hypothetical protein